MKIYRKVTFLIVILDRYTNKIHLALRIEFCKSKARADRWREEIDLLHEEMRRVLAYFDSLVRIWKERASQCFVSWDSAGNNYYIADATVVSGRISYAHQQAAQYRRIKEHCTWLWRYVSNYIQSGHGIVIPLDAQSYIGGGNEDIDHSNVPI